MVSFVWEYFEKKGKTECICKKCNKIIKRPAGNTTNMTNHLLLHGINVNKRKSNDNNCENQHGSSKKQKSDSIRNYCKRETLAEILSKCVANDGFSVRSVIKSEAIKGYLKSRLYTMPSSRATVMKHVMSFSLEKQKDLKSYLSSLKKDGQKFSITTDEWTNINVKRLLNVTLHNSCGESFVLGLVPIEGSCNAEKTVELVKEKLKCFDISLENDIVASTHDGASVMVKYGRLIQPLSQLCYNHAIHLGVVDVFYKKRNDQSQNRSDLHLNEESDVSDSDSECDEETGFFNDAELDFVNEPELVPDISDSFAETLATIRKISKFFRKSAVRNCILQKHVILQEGKQLKLLLDCKTRWNSLIPMVNRFIQLFPCINAALVELGQPQLDSIHVDVSSKIIQVLEPVEITVKELSKEKCHLLKAEGASIYLLNKLKSANTDLSLELYAALKSRIAERRNTALISLLLYLQRGSYPKSTINDHFMYSSRTAIKCLANEMYRRLYGDTLPSNDEPEVATVENDLEKTIETLMTAPGNILLF